MYDGIYFCELNEFIDESIFSKLLSFISEEKQQRIKRLKFVLDKKLTLYADVLVRALACKTYDLKNDELRFAKNEYGKPQLVGFLQFHFNISHTRDAITVAVANETVGIDIERITTTNLDITRRFFTKKEQSFIQNEADNENEINKRFYKIWTQKEAYIKYMGKGLSIPLSSFDVTESGIQDRMYCVENNGYIISACLKDAKTKLNNRIIEMPEDSLLELVLSTLI